jgi:aminotransferase
MLAKIPDDFRNDREAAQTLLENARVASVPGSAFFVSDAGTRMLRFCFAKDFEALEEACRRIRAFRVASVR